MSNVYYSPEAFGLRTVGEVERGGGYDFDTFVLWQAISDGHLWYATDAGCSCPVPFDDVTFADGLTEIHSPQELYDALAKWKDDHYKTTDAYDAEMGELIVKAREVGVFSKSVT